MGPEGPVRLPLHGHRAHSGLTSTRWALRVGGFKLVPARSGGEESVLLFDLARDPGELQDLSQTLPDVTESMLGTAGTVAGGCIIP